MESLLHPACLQLPLSNGKQKNGSISLDKTFNIKINFFLKKDFKNIKSYLDWR